MVFENTRFFNQINIVTAKMIADFQNIYYQHIVSFVGGDKFSHCYLYV